MKRLRSVLVYLFFLVGTASSLAQFPDARDKPPTNWTGPAFRLSQDYPKTRPRKEEPWKAFNFKTQPQEYLERVLQYAYEGNIEVDWDGQKNTVRKWYHAPWLHVGPNGREFVRGLTLERSSRPRELHPNQTSTFRNWAVGLYNPRGGHAIGKVWMPPNAPKEKEAKFLEGAVAVKLLFTTATVAEVPFLQGAKEWQADINRDPNNLGTLRLLQIDIAVRDGRANATTGWVFGTFIYNGNAPGSSPWEKMIPVGLMWGNDPEVTEEEVANNVKTIKESWINPQARALLQHLGWAGRLNGPVDNPRSSCHSCHSQAQAPARNGNQMVAPSRIPDNEKLHWFRNIKARQPFDRGAQSLDYSLQLSLGIQNFRRSRAATAGLLEDPGLIRVSREEDDN
jgi:hypothetical protein